jgi:hypothetical protein
MVKLGSPRFSLEPPTRQPRKWRTKDSRVATFTLTPGLAYPTPEASTPTCLLPWRAITPVWVPPEDVRVKDSA